MNPPGSEIIVVDDDMSMSQAIERLLSAAGWKTRAFASAEELLASGVASTCAALIIDIQLPGLSGLDLVRQLAAAGTVPPFIFITGQDQPHTRDLVRQSGAAAYFTKPFAGGELIRALRQQLQAA